MKLRTATITDAKLLFNWANESSVRSNAINHNPIEWDDHLAWFQKKLQTNDSFIFIAEFDETPIGQIRFDLENNKYLIDYSISKDERGKGYGFLMLKEGINDMKNYIHHLSTFIAWVKPENAASKRVFEKLGFSNKSIMFKGETELIVYELEL
jgi:UDP-2,4-diacetamido-2,4,6-trideoxy-beta-L-altropyranose hydrolase